MNEKKLNMLQERFNQAMEFIVKNYKYSKLSSYEFFLTKDIFEVVFNDKFILSQRYDTAFGSITFKKFTCYSSDLYIEKKNVRN